MSSTIYAKTRFIFDDGQHEQTGRHDPVDLDQYVLVNGSRMVVTERPTVTRTGKWYTPESQLNSGGQPDYLEEITSIRCRAMKPGEIHQEQVQLMRQKEEEAKRNYVASTPRQSRAIQFKDYDEVSIDEDVIVLVRKNTPERIVKYALLTAAGVESEKPEAALNFDRASVRAASMRSVA
jgi:hypothetical protein